MLGVVKRLHPPHSDMRWPVVCERCGVPFLRDDEWQVNQAQVYHRSDTGEEVVTRGYHERSAAGALLDLWWRHGMKTQDGQGYVGADGISLGAFCPNGFLWEVDGEASRGGRWTRTGDPRDPETLTVSPSIVAGDYHGFLGSNDAPPGWFSAHIG